MDIKRVIRVDCIPKIDGKFVSSGKVDYEGDVRCHILFCDEGNHLKTVTFTLSFSDGVDLPEIKDECVANLIPSPESVSCKMLNPRRIAIRMRLDTSVTIWCHKSFSPELIGNISPSDCFVKGTPESMTKAVKELKAKCAEFDNFVLSSGCDIPPTAKIENADAFFAAAKD